MIYKPIEMNRLILSIAAASATLIAGATDTLPAVDVHSHIITDDYISLMKKHDALMEDGYPLPSWDEKKHLDFMDSAGIGVSVLTLSSPQPWFGNTDESCRAIRSINETLADVKSRNPDRFLWCAALPQPDMEESVREALFAIDSLDADGIKLATSVDGKYLGDPLYEPLMKALNDRAAVVILHPVKPRPLDESVFTSGPAFVYEYPVETTRAVLNMVAHNVMTRYPDIKFVVPHAGSFLPYAVPRLKGGYPLLLKQGLTEPFDIEGNLSRLYYDLAGGPSLQAIDMLLTITSPEHILYGSDYPFVPEHALKSIKERMKNDISDNEKLGRYSDDFFRNNALKLFGLL